MMVRKAEITKKFRMVILCSVDGMVTVLLDELCCTLFIHPDVLMNVVIGTEPELVWIADVRIAVHLHQEQKTAGGDQQVV